MADALANAVTLNPWADHWTLDPAVAYLNHGSFGACPRAVLEHQATLRARLEREPVDFLWRDLPALLAGARRSLADFVGADPDDLAFVPNATAGVNAVVRSLRFEPGEEILTTNHVYAACRKTLEYVAGRAGARVVLARVPFPLAGEDDVIGPVLAAVTSKTRLALLDHVTSPTALVFPIERLVRELAERDVDTLVDGAHALGMLPLDLSRLGAAYYTANAHKWTCAPKGSAFLHVRKDRQRELHPVVISHGYESPDEAERFRKEFDWTGTSDPTGWLSIPESLRVMGGLLPGGWPELMERNRTLALSARVTLCRALGATPPCPQSMVGAMASILLPASGPAAIASRLGHEDLSNWTRARGVESWFATWPLTGEKIVRVSAQLYNTEDQFRRLAALLGEAMSGG